HVLRAHRLHLLAVVEILEELLARKIAAMLDDARKPRIVDRDAMELPALAAESELDALALDAHVAVAHRGEPIGFVLRGVALVADADARRFEQAHDRREHLAARQARKR